MKSMRDMARWLLAAMLMMFGMAAQAAAPGEYLLGAGDQIRVTVYQNPDLTLETRIGDTGLISYPLLGSVELGGITLIDAEKKIAAGLKEGNFLKQPQVSIMLIGVASNMVSVLGQVNKPGRFALMAGSRKLSEIMAQAGGIIPGAGSDMVVVSGLRNGQAFRTEIDFTKVFASTGAQEDMTLENGDTIWVDRVPYFYIYGEVNAPGQKVLQRDMTVLQAIATAQGVNQRGTMRGLKVHRKDAAGKVQIYDAGTQDKLRPDDIIYVKESLF
jgi:polysaccharide export outer membrane protein